MTNFPKTIHPSTSYVDDVTVIVADHVNSAHAELNAIETILNKMKDIIAGYTYDRDHIEGLEVLFKTTSSIDLTAGFVCISGTILYSSGTISINTTNNLRAGESLLDNILYHVYSYLDGSTFKAEFSSSDPGADLRHPTDKSRRHCGFIRRAGGNFLAYRQYGDTVLIPTPELWSGGAMGGAANLNLAEYVPPSVYQITLSIYVVANASRIGQFYLSNDSANYWPLQEQKATMHQANDVHTFDKRLPMTETTFDYQLVAGNWGGVYLSEVKFRRKRY